MRALAALLVACCITCSPAAAGQAWLVVSDIHFDPFASNASPSSYGSDSNAKLLDATIAQMRRAEAHPPIVVIAGDFLAHHFARLAQRHGASPRRAALRAMRTMAGRLNAAFPTARFIVALGNNDDYCGDYRSEGGGTYQRSLAGIWAPLVTRNHARTSFDATFPRGGYYSDQTLGGRLRVIVLNDVPWSIFARGACESTRTDVAAMERAWLARALARPNATAVIGHIPPGIDAGTTAILRGFWTVPFLKSRDAGTFVTELRAGRVRWALFGHTHRFDLRLIGGVPALIVASISPVYRNNPAFYVVHLDRSGGLRDVQAQYFDETTRRWRTPDSFDHAFDVAKLDGRTFDTIHSRIGADARVRALWQAQSVSWSTRATIPNWRYAWCAQRVPSAGYAACTHVRARVILAWSMLAIGTIVVLVLLGLFVRRRLAPLHR
ncbi:MAG: metallophosphoesterase [Vulcanimicrobiaceae bacterium]